jgi:methyl-accepting chemotaxis protein
MRKGYAEFRRQSVKNLKIRLKILVSFGIVTVLTLGLSAYVILANLQTNMNTENIRAEVQLQSLSAGLMESFMSASESSAVIAVSFSDSQYGNVQTRIAQCRETLTQIKELTARYPVLESFAVQVGSVETQIENWIVSVDTLQAANKTLEGVISAASTNQGMLLQQSMGIFNNQMVLLGQESSRTDLLPSDKMERVSNIRQGMDIATRLNYIGGEFDAMFRALDTSGIEEDIAYFDNTVLAIEEFRQNIELQDDLDTTAAMLEALEVYRGNINDFMRTMRDREAATNQADLSRDYALSRLDELLTGAEINSISYTETTITNNAVQLLAVSVIAGAVTLASIILGLYISGLINKPVLALSAFMRKAGSTGDIALTEETVAQIERYGKIKDEIGQCIADTAGFIEHVTQIAGNLEMIAQGNLSAEVELLSERDTMGNSLRMTLEKLNAMFAEIKFATDEVANGAQHIADGAQLLAQGSTHQSATIQELSASVTEISEQTKRNAAVANEAKDLGEAIKSDAQQGSQQMSQMMQAVYEINQSSMAIGKVIKIIDDIAFQTNILALNAAVEAARAGQHAKGFAVVADEVRSLAAKSAEAAKNTNELIESSIKKAERGGEISVETSASLERIVEGIVRSSELIAGIAKSSDKQSEGISQIGDAINQVSHVVQQNSATSQQSAAASQELSGQAEILEQLLARFRLKGDAAEEETEEELEQEAEPDIDSAVGV